jgi:hypothetical protein
MQLANLTLFLFLQYNLFLFASLLSPFYVYNVFRFKGRES